MPLRSLIPEVWGKRTFGSPFLELRGAMDRLFDEWFEGVEPAFPRLLEEGNGFVTPRMDVEETDKEIKVLAELPGMEEKDIHINISKDRLTLKGEKKQEKEEKGKNYYRKERSFGSFHREILLPCEVQGDKATAVFKKGVLNITVPKSPQAQKETREIPIKGE